LDLEYYPLTLLVREVSWVFVFFSFFFFWGGGGGGGRFFWGLGVWCVFFFFGDCGGGFVFVFGVWECFSFFSIFVLDPVFLGFVVFSGGEGVWGFFFLLFLFCFFCLFFFFWGRPCVPPLYEYDHLALTSGTGTSDGGLKSSFPAVAFLCLLGFLHFCHNFF